MEPSSKVYWAGFVLTISAIIFYTTFEIRQYIQNSQRIDINKLEDIEI